MRLLGFLLWNEVVCVWSFNSQQTFNDFVTETDPIEFQKWNHTPVPTLKQSGSVRFRLSSAESSQAEWTGLRREKSWLQQRSRQSGEVFCCLTSEDGQEGTGDPAASRGWLSGMNITGGSFYLYDTTGIFALIDSINDYFFCNFRCERKTEMSLGWRWWWFQRWPSSSLLRIFSLLHEPGV